MRTRGLLIALLALLCGSGAASASAAASVLAGAVPDGIPKHHPPLAHAANLPYDGGSVLHSNRTHLVFWAPAGAGLGFDPGYIPLFETFLVGVAHDSHLPSNVYSLTGQYGDSSGAAQYASTYAGAILDAAPLPARDVACQEPPPPPLGEGPGWNDCVTDNQIQTELSRVAAAHRLPVSPTDIYILVTPNGLADCDTGTVPASCALGGADNGGYCAYHSSVSGSGLLYAVIPYNAVPNHCQSDSPRPNASTADPGLSSLSHEHNETITDPLGDGWIDSAGNENGDLCIDEGAHPPPALGATAHGRYDQVIDGGHYWLQSEWSNDDGGCVTRARSDALALTIPRSIYAHSRTTLRGSGSDPHGRIVRLRWFFSDGTTASGFRILHAFRRTGTVSLVVRATDSAGNWTFATRRLRVHRARVRRA